MDMGRLEKVVLLALFILWAMSAVAGLFVGCLARSPRLAFLCGAATAAVAAVVIASTFDNLGWRDLLAISWPPTLLAGFAAAAIRTRLEKRLKPLEDTGHLSLTPDLEQVARARFNPLGKAGDNEAIRPADDDVQVDAGRS